MVVVVSTLENSDLKEDSLSSSAPESWSWQERSVMSLLGMEISYGMEMLPWCSLLGPERTYDICC